MLFLSLKGIDMSERLTHSLATPFLGEAKISM
jgi:hypothetical protein